MNGADIGTTSARLADTVIPSVLGRVPTSERKIFLTIDDGPTDRSIEVDSILEKHGAIATWFLTGSAAERQSTTVKYLMTAGHQFGNHSFGHLDAWKSGWPQVEEDLEAGVSVVQQLTGFPCRWTRPPFGHLRPALLAWCKRRKQIPVLWDVMAFDFATDYDPAAVAARVRSKVRKGSIVVMHDRNTTRQMEAFERTIEGLAEDGWTFGRLPYVRR